MSSVLNEVTAFCEKNESALNFVRLQSPEFWSSHHLVHHFVTHDGAYYNDASVRSRVENEGLLFDDAGIGFECGSIGQIWSDETIATMCSLGNELNFKYLGWEILSSKPTGD